ncbi:MAG: hypothetical protein D6710_06855 [Nitrospirae bacterium]|nr:MAG: hypothetical protein D6710_06855 [Nitrospirota bacterium]
MLERAQQQLRDRYEKIYSMPSGISELMKSDVLTPDLIDRIKAVQRDKIMTQDEQALEQLSALNTIRGLERSGLGISKVIGLKGSLAQQLLPAIIGAEELGVTTNFSAKANAVQQAMNNRLASMGAEHSLDKAKFATYQSPYGELWSGLSKGLLSMGGQVAGTYAAKGFSGGSGG